MAAAGRHPLARIHHQGRPQRRRRAGRDQLGVSAGALARGRRDHRSEGADRVPGGQAPEGARIRGRAGLPDREHPASGIPCGNLGALCLRLPGSKRTLAAGLARIHSPGGLPSAPGAHAARAHPRLFHRLQLEGVRGQLPGGLPHSGGPSGPLQAGGLPGLPHGNPALPLETDRAHEGANGKQPTTGTCLRGPLRKPSTTGCSRT